MAPKQATLGYVKPNQSTLRKFFGARGAGLPQQTRLALATKGGEKGGEEKSKGEKSKEEKSKEEKSKAGEKSKARENSKAGGEADKADQGSDGSSDVKNDGRKRTVKEKAKDDDDSRVAKRPRRARPRIEDDDEDDAMEDSVKVEEDAELAKPTTPVTKEGSGSPGSGKRPRVKNEESSGSPGSGKRPRVKNEESSGSPSSGKRPRVKDEDESDQDPNDESSAESEAEEEKPGVAAKAREKAQAQLLKTKREHPFPDWQAGAPVPYAALCQTFSLIEMTTKRLVIMEHCSLFLRQVMRLTPDDLLPTVLLMVNKLAPDYAGIELGIGESLIMKAIGETTGRSLQVIKADQKEIGDLGLVAVKSRSTQPTMFKPKPLTVRGVHQGLMGIATVAGGGAQGRKVDGIKKLLSAADSSAAGKVDITKDRGGPSEAKFIIRFLEGKLRLGLAEKTVLVSLAQAVVCHEAEQGGRVPTTTELENGESILKTVYSELPSYDAIVPAVLKHGMAKLRDECKLRPGVPLKPMLAKPTKAITEVLDRFEGQTFTCEYKYDGERAQIHYVASDAPQELSEATAGATRPAAGGVASIFSRNSEDLSRKYPDILAKLHSWVRPDTKSFVLDCETVAWDVEARKVLPFQQLMTRKRKDVKVEDVKVKVCVFAFDLLYLNGRAVVGKTLRERRELLRQAFAPVEGEFAFATSMDGRELDEIQLFLDESVKASCEGLMVKMLDGTESGYEPSKRSRNWLKIKKDYLTGIGDSLDLVVLGAYHGRGKRTSVYGAFLLACYNGATETYETVCNIGTGFSEQALEELHGQLSGATIGRPKPFYAHSAVGQHQPDVWFEPRQVWEVKAADLTLSPRYRAGSGEGVDGGGGGGEPRGISLRFPRFVRVRDDKRPEEASSSRQVADMYRRQESVARSKGPAVDDDFEY